MRKKNSPVDVLNTLFDLQYASEHNKRHKKGDFRTDFLEIPDLDGDSEQKVGDKTNSKNIRRFKNKLKTAVKSFSQNKELNYFQLSAVDIKVLAYINYKVTHRYDNDFRFGELMKAGDMHTALLNDQLKYYISLVERNIIAVETRYDREFNMTTAMSSTCSVTEYMLLSLMGSDFRAPLFRMIEAAELDCVDPLNKIYKYLYALTKICPEIEKRDYWYFRRPFGFVMNQFLDRLWDVVNTLDESNLLRRLMASYQIEKFDFCFLMLAYFYNRYFHTSSDVCQILNWISCTHEEHRELYENLDDKSILMKRGDIKLADEDEFNQLVSFSGKLTYDLSVLAKEKKDNKLLDMILTRNKGAITLVNPSQGIDSLILPEEEYNAIDIIVRRLKNPQEYDLSKWDLMRPSLTSETDSLNSCIILLHGYPGTGKTHTAGVIANELGRKLVKIESTNLRNCYYGNTEKNIRQLFITMRTIVAEVSPAPVFLLNEADQIVHKRQGIFDGSVTATENAVQNIFLEEMETFPGILIFTTNLMSNLDEAMLRRFHIKLELKKPDIYCSEKLWRLHLPSTIPGADDISCSELALKYAFTGGQIRIVVQNACYYAMLRGKDSKLTMQDIEIYADLENAGNESVKRSVGF